MDLESIIDEEVKIEDLKKFEKIYNDQVARGEPSSKAAFEYAFCLTRSTKSNMRLGIKLLEELLSRPEADEAKRDYLYYLSVGYLRLKEYDMALKYIGAILRTEPNNLQAKSLRDLIDKRMKRDAAMGAAIVGGVSIVGAAVIIGAITALVRRGGSSK